MSGKNTLSLPSVVPPTCEQCGNQMRLASVEPHYRYTDLDSRNFVCSCGATTSDSVARATNKDSGPP